MKINTTWKEKMRLEVSDGRLTQAMDASAPMGEGTAMTPKQLALAAVSGCTAMDVLALLKKYKQPFTAFSIEADAPMKEGHPATFARVELIYRISGAVDAAKAREAVELSQTKYCGVSAMMASACPITYRIEINGEVVGEGQAKF
jgi:putative redox protein